METKPGTMSDISLRQITKDSLIHFLRMKVHPEQDRFVAPNGSSIAQGEYFDDAWYRGIYAAEEPVGFVMLSIVEDKADYYIWRFMIAAAHQRKGYGKAAMEKVIEYVRLLPNAKQLVLSHVEDNTEAGTFYSSLGFDYTGEKDEDGELMMALAL